jgi:hypothetical protein
VGRTLAFKEHLEANMFFKTSYPCEIDKPWAAQFFKGGRPEGVLSACAVRAARAAGYESIQFYAHSMDGNGVAVPELVDLRMPWVRSGWLKDGQLLLGYYGGFWGTRPCHVAFTAAKPFKKEGLVCRPAIANPV